MVEVLEKAESLKKKSGRPHTLAIEDQLLLTLNYLRNYSTQLELAANYHIAESNVNRTIKKVEDALMKSRRCAEKFGAIYYPQAHVTHLHEQGSYKNKTLLKAHLKSAYQYFI